MIKLGLPAEVRLGAAAQARHCEFQTELRGERLRAVPAGNRFTVDSTMLDMPIAALDV